jgi:hypothetical protein
LDELKSASGFIRFGSVNVKMLMGAWDTLYISEKIMLQCNCSYRTLMWVIIISETAVLVTQSSTQDSPYDTCNRCEAQYDETLTS